MAMGSSTARPHTVYAYRYDWARRSTTSPYVICADQSLRGVISYVWPECERSGARLNLATGVESHPWLRFLCRASFCRTHIKSDPAGQVYPDASAPPLSASPSSALFLSLSLTHTHTHTHKRKRRRANPSLRLPSSVLHHGRPGEGRTRSVAFSSLVNCIPRLRKAARGPLPIFICRNDTCWR